MRERPVRILFESGSLPRAGSAAQTVMTRYAHELLQKLKAVHIMETRCAQKKGDGSGERLGYS